MIIPFGKHGGTDITKLPADYLRWLQDADKNPEYIIVGGINWSHLAKEEILRRKHAGYDHDLFSQDEEG